MSPTRPATAPHQSHLEELVNSITHGVGLVLSLIGGGVLLALALTYGTAVHIVSCALYGATLVFLYGASTFYHAVTRPRLKYIARVLDHVGIYLLIAGTYTPFLAVMVPEPLGWGGLGLVWGCAILGLLFKLLSRHRFHWIAVVPYVVMGWIGILFAQPLIEALSWEVFGWILAGGVVYTSGVVFFGWNRLPFNHAVWHVFVMGGSAIHYVAVLRYVLPQ
ncbi:MAG: hemolysin III family protein [Longimonas sp.]|uniref:PAQR family membrane homeostasis protein TrhA n=1 Tax=Longimonas sp. TaxID=2039626 RepID=UPI00334E2D56